MFSAFLCLIHGRWHTEVFLIINDLFVLGLSAKTLTGFRSGIARENSSKLVWSERGLNGMLYWSFW